MSVTCDHDKFEHDVTVLDRYLAYSTELIRLGLLGIAAIGYLITTDPFSGPARRNAVRGALWIALVAFGIAVAAGLFHRHAAPKGLADHLRLLRETNDADKEPHRQSRNRKFKISSLLLAISAVSLCIGAIAAAYAFGLVL